jgi:hypothetical protein
VYKIWNGCANGNHHKIGCFSKNLAIWKRNNNSTNVFKPNKESQKPIIENE